MSERQDLSHWDSAVHNICGSFATRVHRDIPFVGDIRLHNHGGLEVAHIQTNAERVIRDKLACRDDRYCFLILQTDGTMGFAATNGDEMALKPGDIALIDSSFEFSMLPQGLIQQISVHLPRSMAQSVITGQQPFHKLAGSGISVQTLRSILQQLRFADSQFGASSLDACAIQQAIAALLPAAVQASRQDAVPLKLLAEQHIQRLLQDHRLSPEFLATEMGISRRTLYRLFEEDGESIAQRILHLRLQQASSELQQNESKLSITEIAYRWGFSDVSQFSRAFKREMGMSPRDYRGQQQNSELLIL
ncbi:transcriptional regulator FeaR [Oceanobacter mangrovi]|uniref:transcriptional regulator FeaR n=1 Tax=Oceanobacter mangrovi TaxID=2862510 RepID=UPI001C8E41D1|nr:transcriptional regulator FeaR [Oceanobacter mangrovi]